MIHVVRVRRIFLGGDCRPTNLDLTVHEFLGDEKNEWFLGDEKNDKITDGLDSSRTSRTDMIHAD